MFSSLLSIVDSVLTLDEGCSRQDILSGDQVTIDGNLSRVSGRISGAASLACIRGDDKSKKFFILVGKHKLELLGSMDMNPKPLSMVCPTHKSVRITNDQNKYFEIRFNDSITFNTWLPALGEALAERICSDVLTTQVTSNRIVCSNMRRCIHTCELLTSPSKVYIRRVNELYGIRRKLLEVMGTLRSNPCDVNIKDLRSLKELCWKYPELQSDPDMKFLLERMPSDRYNSEDLQVILKDILYAESDVVCAQVYDGGADGVHHDSTATVASAVLVQDVVSHMQAQSTPVAESGFARNSLPLSPAAATTTDSVQSAAARVAVPVHKKSRIVLNGVEIQSSVRSPSSAGKALSKQIKIKSKFTTPSHRQPEVARPKSKTKTPPSRMNILSEVKFKVSSPLAVASLALVPSSTTKSTASNKMFSPMLMPQDKENMPGMNENATPAPHRAASKTTHSAMKSTPATSLIPIRTKSPSPSAGPSAVVVVASTEWQSPAPVEAASLTVEPLLSKEIAIDLIPEVIEQRQSHLGSPVKSTTNVPFFSPSRCYIPDVASLFDDAMVYAVVAQESNVSTSVTTTSSTELVSREGDKSAREKKAALREIPSLIPSYEAPVWTNMPSSTRHAAKPSKLPVVVERAATSPSPELQQQQVPLADTPEVRSQAGPASESMLVSCTPSTQIASQQQAPPSSVRESRGKKNLLAQSLLSSAKSVRTKHFTPSKESVGMSVAAVPRTPAPVHSIMQTPAKSPARTLANKTPVSLNAEPVVCQTDSVDGTLEKHFTRNNFLFKAGFLVVLILVFCSFAGSMWASPILVPQATPLTGVQSSVQVNSPTVSVPHLPGGVQEQVSAAGHLPVEAPVATKLSAASSEFEIRVLFEGTSPTQPSPSPRVSATSLTHPTSPQTQTMQRHSPSKLHEQLRKLQRLLTLPVKAMRSLFAKAIQKIARIRRALAE